MRERLKVYADPRQMPDGIKDQIKTDHLGGNGVMRNMAKDWCSPKDLSTRDRIIFTREFAGVLQGWASVDLTKYGEPAGMNVFVPSAFRRQGIALSIVRKIERYFGVDINDIDHHTGTPTSNGFYTKAKEKGARA